MGDGDWEEEELARLEQEIEQLKRERGYLADQLQEEKKLRSRETNALINRLSEARQLITSGLASVGGDRVQKWLDDAGSDERDRERMLQDLERYTKRIKNLEKRLDMIVDIAHGKAPLIDLRESFAGKQLSFDQERE